MADRVRIGGGFVDIEADMTKFDNAMAALPKKSSDKMEAAMKALQAKMAQAKLDLKVGIKIAEETGDTAPMVKATALQEQLRDKMERVTAAAVKQAQAIQTAARAATASSVLPTGPKDPVAQLNAMGAAGLKAGKDVRDGGSNGAMGLMMLSQAIDDAQYGKGCRAAA